jgi:hypothetical protein
MAPFFPQVTGTFQRHEYPALRRLTMSLGVSAAVTGVVLRLFRAITLTSTPNERLLFLAVSFGVGLLILFAAVTLHLGNFTVKHWLWRAPAFAAIEATAESLTALGLIALNAEPIGSARATVADWPGIAIGAFLWRTVAVVLYAAVLAGVVQVVRYALTKKEHRTHTLEAIQHESVAHAAKHQDDTR